MAKAIFFSLPLHGHTNPTLPLVRELASRGDGIVYHSAPPFANAIEQTGAHYRPYRNASLLEIKNVPDHMDELSWRVMRTAGELLHDELATFRAERPAYLITDSVAPWGQWIAEI